MVYVVQKSQNFSGLFPSCFFGIPDDGKSPEKSCEFCTSKRFTAISNFHFTE
jgi:hypothetical protein